MITSILISSFLALLIPASAEGTRPQLPSKNCFITTTTEYKDGEIKSKTNSFSFKTKEQCLKTKKLLSENFAPQKIKKVTAKVEWSGK